MDIKIRTADLGDGVIYAVHRTATTILLVINTRPVTDLNERPG